MPTSTSYTDARRNLASLWDSVLSEREPVILHRRGSEDVAMLPADELTGLMETAHLLRSPHNAERLLAALSRAREGAGSPESVETLKEKVGLSEAEEHGKKA